MEHQDSETSLYAQRLKLFPCKCWLFPKMVTCLLGKYQGT